MKQAVLLSWLILPAAIAAECPVKLTTFHIYERTGKHLGCLDQWQQKLFEELGCPLQFINGNPSVAQKEAALQQDKIQLVTGLVKSPKRSFQFSEAFAVSKSWLYRRGEASKWDQIKSWCDPVMQQATIVAMSGLYLGEQVEKLRHDKNCSKWFIETPRGLQHTFSLLDGHRADLLISPEVYLRRLPAEQRLQYKALALPVDDGLLRIAFSATVPTDFIQKVDELILKKRAEQSALCDMDLVSNHTEDLTKPPTAPAQQ